MAEFCLDCYNEIFHKEYSKFDVELTPTLELCEGCAQMKRVVVCKRNQMLADFLCIIVGLIKLVFGSIRQVVLLFSKCIQILKNNQK